jgi:hypothetical protein
MATQLIIDIKVVSERIFKTSHKMRQQRQIDVDSMSKWKENTNLPNALFKSPKYCNRLEL